MSVWKTHLQRSAQHIVILYVIIFFILSFTSCLVLVFTISILSSVQCGCDYFLLFSLFVCVSLCFRSANIWSTCNSLRVIRSDFSIFNQEKRLSFSLTLSGSLLKCFPSNPFFTFSFYLKLSFAFYLFVALLPTISFLLFSVAAFHFLISFSLPCFSLYHYIFLYLCHYLTSFSLAHSHSFSFLLSLLLSIFLKRFLLLLLFLVFFHFLSLSFCTSH